MSRMSSGLVVQRSGMNPFVYLKYFSPTDSTVSLVHPKSSPQITSQQTQDKAGEKQQGNNPLLCNSVVGIETLTPPGIHTPPTHILPGGVSLGPLVTAGDCILKLPLHPKRTHHRQSGNGPGQCPRYTHRVEQRLDGPPKPARIARPQPAKVLGVSHRADVVEGERLARREMLTGVPAVLRRVETHCEMTGRAASS